MITAGNAAGGRAVCSTGFSINSTSIAFIREARRLIIGAAFLISLSSQSLAQGLPPLAVNLEQTTVSGLSSGAYMAGQFQVAYSRKVVGAALVAGGPYGCARTPGGDLNPYWPAVLALNLTRALNKCMEDGWFFSSVPDAGDLFDYTKNVAASDKIDPVDALKDDKVYLFSSSRDDTVERGVVEEAYAFYIAAGLPETNVVFVKSDDAAHAFVTEDQGLTCGETGPPFINDCDYDQAGAILEALLGPLNPPAAPATENFLRFETAGFS